MGILDNPQIQIIFQLLLATFLGGMVGLEREYLRKEAGLRTYSLVSLGATLFTILGFVAFQEIGVSWGISFDPSRVIYAVAIGVGFLGTGVIMRRQFRIEGLTTAAGLWVTAAIGVTVGLKLYSIAFFASFLAVGILAGLRLLEEKVLHKEPEEETEE